MAIPLSTEATTTSAIFSGERWIPEIGLYDDRNRFYDPALGRFLQPDPIGFKGDASNLYRYCGNDWANKTDPMGNDATVVVHGNDVSIRFPVVFDRNSLFSGQQMTQFVDAARAGWGGQFGNYNVRFDIGPATLREQLFGPVNTVKRDLTGQSHIVSLAPDVIFWNPNRDGALGAKHESGHAMGASHSSDPNNLMSGPDIRAPEKARPSEKEIQQIIDRKGRAQYSPKQANIPLGANCRSVAAGPSHRLDRINFNSTASMRQFGLGQESAFANPFPDAAFPATALSGEPGCGPTPQAIQRFRAMY
jgi:RHS repeat-associated protein